MKSIPLLAGPTLGILAYLLLRWSVDMESPAAAVAMLSIWMATWWMTEAVPLELTALLPMLVLPSAGLYAEKPMMKACAPYADETVFFFLGGFGLGLAIEKTELHRRGALLLLGIAGNRAAWVVGAFMLCSALLSMWMNNTATTMLMLPLCMSLLPEKADPRFASSLLIGVAYAASIGGMSTLVGTAPNIFFAGFLEKNDLHIDFLSWMAIALPISAVLLIGCWVWMVGILWPMRGLRIEIPAEWSEYWKAAPGFTSAQRVTLSVFAFAASMWLFREPLKHLVSGTALEPWLASINDPWIAMFSLALLLIAPLKSPVLNWSDVERIPWGILLLFGGGLSLSKAIVDSGLDGYIAQAASSLQGIPTWLLLTCVVILVIAVSEIASNVATATTMLPILMSAASGMGADPITLLSATVLAASCGFMMPVATPPNTMVFAMKRFPVRNMLLAGFGVNLLAVLAIPAFVLWVRPWVLP